LELTATFVQLALYIPQWKNSLKNSCIRIMIQITTEIRSIVASHASHPSKRFHQNSSINFWVIVRWR